MSKKAWMKAAREICGISQQDVSFEADVSVRAVKRWEQPGGTEPPSDVLAWLEEAMIDHAESADEAVAEISKSGERNISLLWYKNQEQCDNAGGADISYTYHNAIMRSVAERLIALGYEVDFYFPDEQ